MPREQINYPDLTFKQQQIDLRATNPDSPASDRRPWNESALHVSWHQPESGMGHVQVGFEVDVEYARLAIEHHNGSTDDRTLMYTPTLSPAEVDRLIASLKRARRKAFRK